MKRETKCKNVSLHIVHPQRGCARTAFRHDSCLQEARFQTHKRAAASRFRLCLRVPLTDHLSSGLRVVQPDPGEPYPCERLLF